MMDSKRERRVLFIGLSVVSGVVLCWLSTYIVQQANAGNEAALQAVQSSISGVLYPPMTLLFVFILLFSLSVTGYIESRQTPEERVLGGEA